MLQHKIFCPAKINLFLKVIAKYDDNYHELESVLCFIDLYDYLDITIIPSITKSNLSLKISSNLDFKDIAKNNILYKIHNYFTTHYKINYDFKITLHKNIPLGSGLGGASSNAAFFMKFINDICQLNITANILEEISFNFGSDIAFFLQNDSAIIRQKGRISQKFYNATNQNIILIYPNINISTASIFNNYNHIYSQKTQDVNINNYSQKDLIINFTNDLQNIVINKYPFINNVIDNVMKYEPIICKMSGSGSSFFAIFNNDSDLNKAYYSLLSKFPSYFIKKCQILTNV